jgi:hypothetical protein
MRWAALAAIVGLHLLALPQVFQDIPLRADSDTAVMLDAVQRHGALRWLVGDWLLENGFYRPVSSLSIALDYALYGESGWGFRLTNWLLMVLIAIGAWTLVRAYARLVGNLSAEWLALGVGVALSLQQAGLTGIAAKWSAWWFVAITLVGTIGVKLWQGRGALNPPTPVPSPPLVGGERVRVRGDSGDQASGFHGHFGLLLALGALFWGFDRLLATEYARLITWVPSRTALLGTVFSVWAMYALVQGATGRRWGWLAVGGALYLLALGSYEQPITLVAVVGALAFWRRRDWGGWGARVFAIAALCAALIVALRFALIPAEPSTYQQQQLRSSLSGPVFTYLTELLPPVGQWQYWHAVGLQLEVLLVEKTGWDYIAGTVLYLGVLVAVWRWRGLLGGAWLWHALAFLPMAFLHFFEHYMCLPQLGKTLFDVGLIAWGVQQLGVQFGRFAGVKENRADV